MIKSRSLIGMVRKASRRLRRRTLKHRRALRRRRITRRAKRLVGGGGDIPDDDNTLVDAIADPGEIDSLPHPTPVNVYKERFAPDAAAI